MGTGTERRATGGIGLEERKGCGNRGEEQRQELGEVVGPWRRRPSLDWSKGRRGRMRRGREGLER